MNIKLHQELNEEEIKKYGRIYNLKSSLGEKYSQAQTHKAAFTKKEQDKLRRSEHMVTGKKRDYCNQFTNGMAVNRVFLNALNGHRADAEEIRKELDQRVEQGADPARGHKPLGEQNYEDSEL